MIFPLPVNAVGLKGISPVGAEQYDASARFQDADHFADTELVVIDVFDHLMAEDQVKIVVFERQILTAGVDDIRIIIRADLFGELSPFKFNFDPDRMAGCLHKAVQICADAAAVFQNVSVDPFFRVLCNQSHTALLSVPPDIGGFTAFRSFVRMFLPFSYIFHLLFSLFSFNQWQPGDDGRPVAGN